MALHRAPLLPLLAALLLLLLAIAAVRPARGQIYAGFAMYDVPSCVGTPVIQVMFAADNYNYGYEVLPESCSDIAELVEVDVYNATCEDEGAGMSVGFTCTETSGRFVWPEAALEVPYMGAFVNENCTTDFSLAFFMRANGECGYITLSVSETDISKGKATCNGTHVEIYYECNEDCSECDNHEVSPLGCCGGSTSVCSACRTEAFTSVYEHIGPDGGEELDSDPSSVKDCYALNSATLQGGYTVTYDSEQVRRVCPVPVAHALRIMLNRLGISERECGEVFGSTVALNGASCLATFLSRAATARLCAPPAFSRTA